MCIRHQLVLLLLGCCNLVSIIHCSFVAVVPTTIDVTNPLGLCHDRGNSCPESVQAYGGRGDSREEAVFSYEASSLRTSRAPSDACEEISFHPFSPSDATMIGGVGDGLSESPSHATRMGGDAYTVKEIRSKGLTPSRSVIHLPSDEERVIGAALGNSSGSSEKVKDDAIKDATLGYFCCTIRLW